MKALTKLTLQERKIYNAIMLAFPKTNKESAINHAIQGGVRFQYTPR